LNHLTIGISFVEDYVEAVNCMDMTAKTDLELIEPDAKDLEVMSVEWVDAATVPVGTGTRLTWAYCREVNKLSVSLPRLVRVGERFLVRTVTRCVPTDNVLEGIYKDVTPPGAPQQYMSQCQQWGFQRIMPVFDDCRAKCTMTVTIEGDARYTHMISNGDICLETNPDRVPVIKTGDPSRRVITFHNRVPMAPYLFLVCAGTWDALTDHVTYPSGRTVRLEYLVPPGRVDGARVPMDILKRAVIWIERTQGYEYAGDTYRTICMSKSNFGGMENVGNTTIVTDAALIDEHTPDSGLIYAHGVIVHEFEHNQCGSETTMETPFDVWLNEAYTVDVERSFLGDMFDPTFMRLAQVDGIRNPLLGPLVIEDSGRAGRIVREGFDNPDDLIDGVTYVKAADVIRMLRLIIGAEAFIAGRELYFSRYRNSNAHTAQFFECFEEASGRDLSQFRKGWLETVGYPKVKASTSYDSSAQRFTLRFVQQSNDGEGPFHIPIELALVDQPGMDIVGSHRVLELTLEEQELSLDHIPVVPAFASLNRDYSFYGTFEVTDASTQTLAAQARFDSNLFNRVEAMRRLTDRERIKLLQNADHEISADWLSVYGSLLEDPTLPAGLKGYLLRIEEQPIDREYAVWFPELVAARSKLMNAVNRTHHDKLTALFHSLDTYRSPELPTDGIEDRVLKNVLLDLIVVEDTQESRELIMNHYRRAVSATDRVAALLALNRSSSPDRLPVLKEVYDKWHGHLSGYANYLRVVAGGTGPDVFDMIAAEERKPSFDLNQPTWTRALFLSMAVNNKMVWTDQGIAWIADTIVRLSSVNDYTAGRLLNTFQMCRKLKPDLQAKVRSALVHITDHVTAAVSPTVSAQARAYLDN
ncbi:MAG: DUF3458 domain-containing protein, partial [Pseudomonadota bacterium]